MTLYLTEEYVKISDTISGAPSGCLLWCFMRPFKTLAFLRLLQTFQNFEILYKIKYQDDGECLSSKPLLLTLIDSPGLSCDSLRCEWLLL